MYSFVSKYSFLKKDFIYLFFSEREKNNDIDWLPLTRPLIRDQPTTQAYAPTGNGTHEIFALLDDAQPTEPHWSGQQILL